MHLAEKANQHRPQLDVNIFRGYDVRGDATQIPGGPKVNLQPEDAWLIGQALASLYTEKKQTPRVLITADHRPSSEDLKQALAQGLAAGGAQVWVQKSPTPTGATSWYILEKADELDMAIQITGSHNPYYNNGFKITCKQNETGEPDINSIPQALYGEKLKALYDRIIANKVVHIVSPEIASQSIHYRDDIVTQYQNGMLSHFQKVLADRGGKFRRTFRMVLDAGNGLGCKAIPILQALGVQIEEMFTDLQGTFPNHPADPSKADGIKAAQERVKQHNKDIQEAKWFATVFDGDGDRSGVIDESGQGLYPERILVIYFTRFLLENLSGFHLLSRLNENIGLAQDVRSTAVVCDVVAYFGKINALRKYYLEHGVPPSEVEQYYTQALAQMWRKCDQIPVVPSHFPKIPAEEWQKILATQRGFGAIGEYIPAGYPNHRSYVRQQIQKIDRIIQQHHLNPTECAALRQIQHQYTSAESSGHFFYGTCEKMPEVMVDDGIYSVCVLLNILETLPDFEVKAGLMASKPEHSLTDLFSSITWRPVSNEIRDGAPQDNALKFKIVSEITNMIQHEQQHPTGKFKQPIRAIITADGIRAEFEDGSFALVRASNTSPMLTYKFEALTTTRLGQVIEEMIAVMQPYVSQGVTIGELQKERKLY